jgi:regulatory protein
MQATDGQPAKITSLRPTQRDPNRTTVFVEGKSVGTINNLRLSELNLAVGDPWTPQLAEVMVEAVAYDKAFRAATRRLARRAMSESMLRRKLKEAEHAPEAIEQVMQRLHELDLLDDEAFGRALIREATLTKAAGPRLLSQKLYAKGLDRQLIDRLVAEATQDDNQQIEDATTFAEKKLRSMQRLDTQAKRRRLYGQLARRGFTPDTIRTAMSRAMDEDEYAD